MDSYLMCPSCFESGLYKSITPETGQYFPVSNGISGVAAAVYHGLAYSAGRVPSDRFVDGSLLFRKIIEYERLIAPNYGVLG